jgi:hypothetical protein
MRTASKKPYHGLCSALLSNISDADQTQITNIDKNNRKIVYFSDAVSCFEGVINLNHIEKTSCICGKRQYKHVPYHK